MDAAELVYRNEQGNTERVSTGKSLPNKRDMSVDSIDVDEEGEWVLIEVSNPGTGAEGSIMIPKGRVIRIDEGAARQN